MSQSKPGEYDCYGHKYSSTANHHTNTDGERCRIKCETQRHEAHLEGYPVLHIGTVAFFPTVEQLRRLVLTVDVWVRAYDAEQAAKEQAARQDAVDLAATPDRSEADTAELTTPPVMHDPTDAANMQASSFGG